MKNNNLINGLRIVNIQNNQQINNQEIGINQYMEQEFDKIQGEEIKIYIITYYLSKSLL